LGEDEDLAAVGRELVEELGQRDAVVEPGQVPVLLVLARTGLIYLFRFQLEPCCMPT
jgi:hypothetical protein